MFIGVGAEDIAFQALQKLALNETYIYILIWKAYNFHMFVLIPD